MRSLNSSLPPSGRSCSNEGTVTLDSGVLANARVNLAYTRITAPISGQVGLRRVDPGNIVHANDVSGIVVITQMRPMSVIFPISEDNLPRLLAKMKTNSSPAVQAYDRSEKTMLAEGNLFSTDNEIDSATGTVHCRALFSNEKRQLFPGQFVNVHLLVDVREGTMIVPQAAVQKGPQGAFVIWRSPTAPSKYGR